MATLVVTGVAASIVAEHPRVSVDDLRQKVLASEICPQLKGKIVTGGRVNAAKAVHGS